MNKILLMLVMVSLVLASCGSSSSPSTDLKVTLTDFQFTPNRYTVPAGEEITFSGSNTGAVAHDFVIFKLGQTAGSEYTKEDEPNVYWEAQIAPGDSVETTFVAPSEPGEYEVICKVPGHLQAGMIGKMVVVTNE